MNRHLFRAAACIGLAVIGWVGSGYLHTNPLALGMTVLIGACYAAGVRELWRFDATTADLDRAMGSLAQPVPNLGDWLDAVPASLRHAVRLRIEGERVALPGPTLTPYLTGLLVLLGMLGTFLGMVVTLKGTGLALEHATDLQTMRESLAAPVKGLGLAFGTSVAGVAASAMLGLLSTLCRRERLQAAQVLDTRIATSLRPFTRAHRQEESLRLQQQQAEFMPALVGQLQGLIAQLDVQARQSDARLLASQDRFHGQAEAAYRSLAASVDRTLRESLTHSLAEGARVAAATLQPAVVDTMSGITRETAALHGHLAATVEQQLDGLSRRFEASTLNIMDTWAKALARHETSSEAMAQRLGESLDGFNRSFERRSASWLDAVAGESHRSTAAVTAHFERQAESLLRALDHAHSGRQTEEAARDEQRLAAWTATLSDMAASLQHEWQQAGAHTLTQQAQICKTLEQTAARIAAQTEAHATRTIAEIARLVQTASEAPRAAADVIAQLRDKLSDSMRRDNAMLEERSRLMATLASLLDAVQHTSGEQKAAIDTLVASTASWLEQAGQRFTDKLDAESARMEAVAAQLGGSAVEVASLGEAFGVAVDLFSQSSDKLMTHLQHVDETLGRSITRSDEQLAYYVAQAREVIDLSLMAQKQIVDDLQRIAGRQADLVGEA